MCGASLPTQGAVVLKQLLLQRSVCVSRLFSELAQIDNLAGVPQLLCSRGICAHMRRCALLHASACVSVSKCACVCVSVYECVTITGDENVLEGIVDLAGFDEGSLPRCSQQA